MRLVRGGIAATLLVGITAVPAAAEPNDPVRTLCADAPNGCTISGPATTREGTVLDATVVGQPNVVGRLVVYRVDLDDHNNVIALTPISTRGTFRTGGTGATRASVPIAPMAFGTGGWAFLSLVNQEQADFGETVGAFIPLGSRVPMLLGDGFATDKPVGRSLDLQVVGAVPGTRFAVEYRDENGVWRDTTDPNPGAVQIANQPDQISHIRYRVPRGLQATAHEFRLRNLSDTAVSDPWQVVPSTTGTPAARRTPFTPPPVGNHLDTANLPAAHPEQLVQTLLWGLVAIVGTPLVLAVPLIRSRRPVAHA